MSYAVEAAIKLALEAHEGQKDKIGNPYIIHPIMVMAELSPDESLMIVGILHDTMEDSSITIEEIDEKVHLTSNERDALILLTHKKHEPYRDYIQKIKDSNNAFARTVKMADISHNMDRNMEMLPEETKIRLQKKYRDAVEILTK